MEAPEPSIYFERDLSWLGFNERVLTEASRKEVPLLERIKFLSIFSSNLDEFYRVRMPVLQAFKKIESSRKGNQEGLDVLEKANAVIYEQQLSFGSILRREIIPTLAEHQIFLIYNSPIPDRIQLELRNYFMSQVMAFIQPVDISERSKFFPANNELYFLITLKKDEWNKSVILNIPSSYLPRFFKIQAGEQTYVVFLDDIVRHHLDLIFPGSEIIGCYSFKITRDAEIDLKDEYPGSLSDQLETLLKTRDNGLATRFLHQPDIPLYILSQFRVLFNLENASLVEGGRYHNLKDFGSFPVHQQEISDQAWPRTNPAERIEEPLLDYILKEDLIIHTPYQSYDAILRFFNEAAIDKQVSEIYVTLYRVANDSKIVNALISAAKNGKKVTVLVELKARFDEANNIKWAKKMKEAGVEIIYSATALKVHAKIALVKRRWYERIRYLGLLSTGNFNETTASFYTDHILMTAHQEILREMELLFIFLAKRIKPSSPDHISFKHLLVAQFNLQPVFLNLIDREIQWARQGKPASIIIKLNNLEERVLINKLYEASRAGVKISLIVRSICCLIPGMAELSENITVVRIIDRYLEHGRIFVFHNQGDEKVYLGSADWMNRNIYRRIEVCFPVYDPTIKTELLKILGLQLQDNFKAVKIDSHLKNIPVHTDSASMRSQYEICRFLKNKQLHDEMYEKDHH